MTTCRHTRTRFDDCDLCAQRGEQREAGEHLDVVNEADYQRLEDGPWWSSFPGMGAA